MKFIRLIAITLFIVTGCSDRRAEVSLAPPAEQIDFSCSSFYFLWGTHAEYAERYPEALEAYEKALICDPGSKYIEEKLPILMLKMGDYKTAATWLSSAITKDPTNTTYLLFLANISVQQQNITQAVTLYEKILTFDPDNEPVNTRLGILYSHLGKYEIAENIFRSLLVRNPQSYFTTLSLARLLNQKNDGDKAALFYEKALSLNWSKELAFEIGYLYSSKEKYKDALRIYTTITDNDTFDEKALLGRVQALLDLNRLAEANTALQNIHHVSEQPDKIDLIMSQVLLQQRRPAEAKKILQRLNNQSEAYAARYMLALLAYQEADYPSSIAYVTKIPASSENFEEAVYLKIKVLKKQQKSDEAIAFLENNIKDDATTSPLFYALLSSLFTDSQHTDLALSTLRDGITTYPENHQLHFELGLLLEKNGRTNDAIAEMRKVLALQADHADALNFIGYSLADKGVHLEEALGYILHAISLKPENGFIIDSLGWVYFRLGRLKEAAETLEHAVSLEPNDPHIFDHLGDSYNALGEYDNAQKAYKKAYDLFDNKDKQSTVKDKIDAITN
ncbi:MAG: hypothetical protein COA36_00680 [Desulfotalea sp.]|nr:MAG: hypothetical protein COA36_00680 [Desulfotalea sp.]